MQWEVYCTENNYSTSLHHWCGLGVRDSDTRKAPVRHTRISSTRSIASTLCNCGDPSSHVFQLRVERRPDGIDRGESAPHQIALHDWATSITKILQLPQHGPWVTQKGDIRRHVSFGPGSSPVSGSSKDDNHKKRLSRDASNLGQDQKHPDPTESTERHQPSDGSGGSAAAPALGLVPETGIRHTHPSREGSPQGQLREAVAAPLLRRPEAPVEESERSYSARRGGDTD